MPLHVSSTVVLIIRRSELYYTASGIITTVGGRPVHQLSLAQFWRAFGISGWGVFWTHQTPTPWYATEEHQIRWEERNKETELLGRPKFYVLIIRRSELYYTASGIITPVGGRPVHRLREDWEARSAKQQNLPTFRDNRSVPPSGVKDSFLLNFWPLKVGPTGCPETSASNWHRTLRILPEKGRFNFKNLSIFSYSILLS